MTYADIPPGVAPFDRLLVASTNPGKLREIRRILAGIGVPLTTLAESAPIPEPEETGQTFEANAELKARYYAAASGLATVAEDSGLAIDALGGRPGVLSARYPGETYAAKFANLYRELAPHPRPWRARFVCALAVADSRALGVGHRALASTADQALGSGHSALASTSGAEHSASAQCPTPRAQRVLFCTQGVVEGEIAPAPRGAHGFGYDPIFFYPPYGCTLGEATDDQKLAISHRGQAFRKLRDWLRERRDITSRRV